MGVFSVALLVVFGIAAVLLVIVVLLQDEQSEGLGGIFGGSSSNQVGNRKGNILTKTTSVLGFLFLAVAFSLALVNRSTGFEGVNSAAQAKANETKPVEWWAVSPSPAVNAVQSPVPSAAGSSALGAKDLEAPASSPSASPAAH